MLILPIIVRDGSGLLGAALTQLEAEIAFSVLMQRLPTLSLAGETPVWQGNAAYRALDRLSVFF